MSDELVEDEYQMESECEDEPLPTLYDYLLSQEKLAAEIRRQNKELRLLTKELAQLKEHASQLEDQLLSLSFPAPQEPNQEQTPHHDHLLMAALDVLFTLKGACEESIAAALDAMPKTSGFWRKSTPQWRTRCERILSGYGSGVGAIHDKLLSFLKDMRIEVLIPQIHEPFSPQVHRALEKTEGGESNTIAKVIRYGYLKDRKLLRYADVAVFNE